MGYQTNGYQTLKLSLSWLLLRLDEMQKSCLQRHLFIHMTNLGRTFYVPGTVLGDEGVSSK